MKKTMAALAASALLVPAAALLAPGLAQAAPEDSGKTGVRAADLITALSDTRTSGHKEFLAEGIHVWTEGTTGQDKVAEYFPVTVAGGLPTTSKMEWLGSGIQPGVQIVFDVDGTTGNGNDFNILVGEPVYGVDGSGNYTDWWASTGSFVYNKQNPDTGNPGPANLCPSTTGGSGSGCHGSLADWKTKIPGAKMYAGGFSLGSGVKNDGVIRSISYDGVSYVPTNEAKPTTPAPGQGTTTTPTTTTKPVKDVTGTVKAKTPNKLRLKLSFVSDATPSTSTEGKALKYKVKVDGVLASKVTQGAGEKDVFARVFPRNSGVHKVQVYKNGELVNTYKVPTA